MKFSTESELYPIIKTYLESEGFNVRSEVSHCDIVAQNKVVTIIIELKLAFNLKLVFQVLRRQDLCPNVFIALPEYALDNKSNRKKDILKLMKKMNIGVFVIGIRPSGMTVELLSPIELTDKETNKKLLAEFQGRSIDLNSGGVVREKLVTAYREQALSMATLLYLKGPMRAFEIKKLTGIEKAPTILTQNYYDWFIRISRGVYTVGEQYEADREKYIRLHNFYVKEYERLGILI